MEDRDVNANIEIWRTRDGFWRVVEVWRNKKGIVPPGYVVMQDGMTEEEATDYGKRLVHTFGSAVDMKNTTRDDA